MGEGVEESIVVEGGRRADGGASFVDLTSCKIKEIKSLDASPCDKEGPICPGLNINNGMPYNLDDLANLRSPNHLLCA